MIMANKSNKNSTLTEIRRQKEGKVMARRGFNKKKSRCHHHILLWNKCLYSIKGPICFCFCFSH